MKHRAFIILLAFLGVSTVHAADTDRELARQLALQQKNLLPLLSSQQYQSPLPNLLQKASPRLKRQAIDVNQAAISRQGLDGEVKQLMQLRLANPEQAAALQQGVEPLVAYVPSGDEKSWSAIEAFDSAGNPVYLDVDKAPARPVLVVEADPVKAKNAGLQVMRKAFAAADMQALQPKASTNTAPFKTKMIRSPGCSVLPRFMPSSPGSTPVGMSPWSISSICPTSTMTIPTTPPTRSWFTGIATAGVRLIS